MGTSRNGFSTLQRVDLCKKIYSANLCNGTKQKSMSAHGLLSRNVIAISRSCVSTLKKKQKKTNTERSRNLDSRYHRSPLISRVPRVINYSGYCGSTSLGFGSRLCFFVCVEDWQLLHHPDRLCETETIRRICDFSTLKCSSLGLFTEMYLIVDQ